MVFIRDDDLKTDDSKEYDPRAKIAIIEAEHKQELTMLNMQIQQ